MCMLLSNPILREAGTAPDGGFTLTSALVALFLPPLEDEPVLEPVLKVTVTKEIRSARRPGDRGRIVRVLHLDGRRVTPCDEVEGIMEVDGGGGGGDGGGQAMVFDEDRLTYVEGVDEMEEMWKAVHPIEMSSSVCPPNTHLKTHSKAQDRKLMEEQLETVTNAATLILGIPRDLYSSSNDPLDPILEDLVMSSDPYHPNPIFPLSRFHSQELRLNRYMLPALSLGSTSGDPRGERVDTPGDLNEQEEPRVVEGESDGVAGGSDANQLLVSDPERERLFACPWLGGHSR